MSKNKVKRIRQKASAQRIADVRAMLTALYDECAGNLECAPYKEALQTLDALEEASNMLFDIYNMHHI